MKKFIYLGGAVAILLVGFVAYRMVQANVMVSMHNERFRAVEGEFTKYGKLVLDDDFEGAYQFTSATFRKETDFAAFKGIFADVSKACGRIHRIQGKRITGRGSNEGNTASYEADFEAQNCTIPITHQYRWIEGRWLLDSFRIGQVMPRTPSSS